MPQYSILSTVKHRIAVGEPLTFSVRDADTTLLLAKGQIVTTGVQMEALFRRGALVDMAELISDSERIRLAPRDKLPDLWRTCLSGVGDVLEQAGNDSFLMAVESNTAPVLALVERDPDLAIFHVLRQDASALSRYGINHSVHAAIASFLVARRLGWDAADSQRAFKAALTMNISKLELQGQLATQIAPITPEQREAVRAHPWFSRRMLEIAGLDDREWLDAVLQHHEAVDGSGYPSGRREICETASILRRADVYVTKLSPRAGRSAIAADQACRLMYAQDSDNPMTVALVKEFGIYPPGCFVRLASGETGLVVKRGPTVATPVVAAMISASGQNLAEPVRRDTSRREFAVSSVLQCGPDVLRVATEQLHALAA